MASFVCCLIIYPDSIVSCNGTHVSVLPILHPAKASPLAAQDSFLLQKQSTLFWKRAQLLRLCLTIPLSPAHRCKDCWKDSCLLLSDQLNGIIVFYDIRLVIKSVISAGLDPLFKQRKLFLGKPCRRAFSLSQYESAESLWCFLH